MRRFIVTTGTAAALIFAATALAALPTQRVVFKGVTSEHAINGYKPTVQFTALSGGRQIKYFVFQTLGCFGHGAFPVGVDPFVDTIWRVTSISIPKSGAFTAKVRPRTTTPDAGEMTATISGTFTSSKRVVGKIVFSQVQAGSECGPQTVKYAATAS